MVDCVQDIDGRSCILTLCRIVPMGLLTCFKGGHRGGLAGARGQEGKRARGQEGKRARGQEGKRARREDVKM